MEPFNYSSVERRALGEESPPPPQKKKYEYGGVRKNYSGGIKC
jgi:hypothetical protein